MNSFEFSNLDVEDEIDHFKILLAVLFSKRGMRVRLLGLVSGDPNVSELGECHFLSRDCGDFSIWEDHIPLSEIKLVM